MKLYLMYLSFRSYFLKVYILKNDADVCYDW